MDFEKLITVSVGLLAAFRGVHEYVRQGRWARGKYLIERLDVFRAKESTAIVCSMLDWNSVELKVGERRITLDDYGLYAALQTHDVKNNFTDVEVEVRRLFDAFFDDLHGLVTLCRVGLVDERDLRVHLAYWVNILSGWRKSKPPALVEQFATYMEFYGYGDVLAFIRG